MEVAHLNRQDTPTPGRFPVPREIAVSFDYRCPFARNAHEHLVTALSGGADWEVDFVPFSLSQVHVEEGQPAVWDDPDCDIRLKKRVVQSLIREVVADVTESGRETRLVLHWVGGVHTELRVPRSGRGQCSPTATNVIDAVRVLARVLSDQHLAAVLNRHGLPTGRGNRWTAMRVT